MNVRDKIAKLLALSESPNENEAAQALLKAKELMMQHKLSMQDLSEGDAQVLHRETDITFSKRRNAWTLMLANVIAENYCCRAFSRRRSRQQTRHICLAGFLADVELCERVLRYALGCIHAWIGATVRINRDLYTTKERNALADSYAKGYIAGIYTAYRRQAAAHEKEWALVSVVPSKVDDSVGAFRTEKISEDGEVVRSIYNVGFSDGVRFCVRDKLTNRAQSRQKGQKHA